MREYSIKRGHHPDVAGIIETYFGITDQGDEELSFETEGIGKIHLRYDKKSVFIETEPQPNATGGEGAIKKWNNFLFDLTGCTSKERKKMMEKKAKK